MEFELKEPPINIGSDISLKSFETIQEELKEYEKINNFNEDEKVIIERLIHTTTCFDNILDNIYFTDNATSHIKELLENKAKIIVDTNMIKSGLSDFYTKKYDNEVICYINEPFTYEYAEKNKTTRSYAAVEYAIEKFKDQPMILACGNAPTFIYAAVNTLVKHNVDPKNVAFLLFPVGFVNVVESKEYGRSYLEHFNTEGIILEGRYGASTMIVATLHAIYRLIKDFDGTSKYNGK